MSQAGVRRAGWGRALDAGILAGGIILAGLIAAAAFAPPQPPPSAMAALRRLAQDPLDLPALRAEGLALDASGGADRAARILAFVQRRSWRDTPTDAWLLRHDLEQGDLAGALGSADALLRLDADGRTRPVLFALLTAAADYPEARPALESHLAADPWWRPDFLTHLAAVGGETGTLQLLSALAGGPHPPRPEEYAAYVGRLVAKGDYAGALNAWTLIARGGHGGHGGAAQPRDGDFTQAWDHTAFTWSVADGVGAASETRDAADGPPGRVLRVDYDGYASPTLPAQLLVLPPGPYVLTWRERTDAGPAGRLFWRLRCADSGRILAGSADAEESSKAAPGWRDIALTFQPPATGCAGQWLELAAVPGERRDPVTARYAAFRLRPAP